MCISCCLVLFVSTLGNRLAGKTDLMISFMLNGFAYEDQIDELFIVMVSFCIFPPETFSTFSLI